MIDPGAPALWFDALDSTSLEARRRAEAGDLEPVWVIAREQSAGKGRRGRSWLSPKGGLYATYLGVTAAPPAETALLSFAAGVAVADMLGGLGAFGAQLKWPNDVLLRGGKIAGILLEASPMVGANAAWFALGVGVNLAGAPQGLDQPTNDVTGAGGPEVAPEAAFAALRAHLTAWSGRLQTEGFAPIRQAWRMRAYGLGLPIRVHTGQGEVQGTAVDLDSSGGLIVDTGQKRLTITAGEVFFPPTSGS